MFCLPTKGHPGAHSAAIFVGILYLWEYFLRRKHFISGNFIFVGAFYPQQIAGGGLPDPASTSSIPRVFKRRFTGSLTALSFHLNVHRD